MAITAVFHSADQQFHSASTTVQQVGHVLAAGRTGAATREGPPIVSHLVMEGQDSIVGASGLLPT
jgi:hypothetical protein